MAVKNNNKKSSYLTDNQGKCSVKLPFKRLTGKDLGSNPDSQLFWRKTLILTLLSSLGLTNPMKAMTESETLTASIPIPVSPAEESAPEAIALSPQPNPLYSSTPIPVLFPDVSGADTTKNLIAQTETNPPQTTPQVTPTPPQTTPQVTPTSPQTTPQPTSEEARVLVSEVDIAGVDGELKDLVYNTIRTNPGRTTTRSRLQEDINAIYATGYFSNVRVTPEDTQYGVKITFELQPNPVLNRLEIDTLPAKSDGQSSLLPKEVIDKAFEDQYGRILNLRDLQEGIAELNKWYTDNGYDLAQVVGAPQISPDGVVTLIIAEGQLENIQVRFFNEEEEEVNGKTRDFIVTREMKLKPGDVFNRRTAQQDLQRVFGLGIFEDVKLSFSPGEDPSEVVMNVDIVEGKSGSLGAGAGISSSSGLFGTVSYQERNFGGNNQTLGTEFQLGERELLFDLNFQDPWIAGDPYRTSYSANLFRRRSISLVYDGTDTETIRTEVNNDSPRVVRTGAGISFSRPLSEDVFTPAQWVISTGIQYQNIEVQDADGDRSPRSGEAFGNQKLAFNNSGVDDLITVRLNAAQDTRNNSLNPTSGSLLLLGMEQTVPLTSILYNRIRANYSYYLPVKLLNFDFMEGPQAFAFNFQAGTVLGDLPPYEAFVLGGSNSVRGYGEGDLGNGRSYFQATAEYRFPIVSFLGGTVFFDYGTNVGSQGAVIGKPAEVRGLSGDGFGYGLGVRVQSPVGPIRIDYAINDEGDSRVHFGIGEKF
ncbi:BamA/TamA family outer membrane protein [Geminocystis herdmanii]|uniref:BamA/TamA family outer membrane protein n=1 Tax=Geminocystis herdmanii TaxID=669359 RepID=UPI0003475FB1